MARKRKLTAPSAEDLSRYEEEFRRETPGFGPRAPIAQVAADAAREASVLDAEAREKAARTASEAEAYRKSREDGLLIQEIPLEQIHATALIRDRAFLDETQLNELKHSIIENGLRLPIEVCDLAEPTPEGHRFALISGYRRYKAMADLREVSIEKRYETIKAIVRPPKETSEALAAMVEENEVRADLSHFERGRIASLAVRSEVFGTIEEAVNTLFAVASKAKRSKIRSFALIFDDLGDLLLYPEELTEKQGLRIASALRAGADTQLRRALADATPSDSVQEWAVIEPIIDSLEDDIRDNRKGGRPTKSNDPRPRKLGQNSTSSGFTIYREEDSRGYLLRIGGRKVDAEMLDLIVAEVTRLLERPR